MSDEELVDVRRFEDLYRITRRPSSFVGEGFDESNPPCWNQISILVVGAGGLGCELLHCLALSGFTSVHVIDMDTIDLTNLNRQFLFRQKDIGSPKATVAANYINAKFPWMRVVPHFGRIESMDDDFYRQFQLVILGLDSIHARQWMSAKYASLRTPEVSEEDGSVRFEGAVPIIDGGTEGFKGSVRHITLGTSACIDCAMYLYPPTKRVPFCTLENVPRAPEHCVLYVKEKLWDDEKPFNGEKLDGDNPSHIEWIVGHARTRQAQFKIPGDINFRFTQGVVKNVVAAVGFTNAMIAAMCVTEAFKLATGVGKPFDNYVFYDGGKGICCYSQPLWNNPDCETCQLRSISIPKTATPQQIVDEILTKKLIDEKDKSPILNAGDLVNLCFLVPKPVEWVSVMLPASHPGFAATAKFNGRPVHDSIVEVCVAQGLSQDVVKGPLLDVSGGKLRTKCHRFLVAWK